MRLITQIESKTKGKKRKWIGRDGAMEGDREIGRE